MGKHKKDKEEAEKYKNGCGQIIFFDKTGERNHDYFRSDPKMAQSVIFMDRYFKSVINRHGASGL